jgi:hypothetical protein
MSEISGAIAIATAGFELLKVALAAKNEAQIRAATTDLAERLLQANNAAIAATDKISTLQADLAKMTQEAETLRAKLAQKQAYEPYEISPGMLVLRHKRGEQDTTPLHYVCAACASTDVMTPLQHRHDGNVLVCPNNPAHNLYPNGEPQPAQRGVISRGI